MKKQISKILLILLTSIFITGCSLDLKSDKPIENGIIQENVQLTDIPEFNDEPYIVLNENVPMFTEEETASTEIFEDYSDLDRFGRCGIAYANLHQSIMPTEDRESIGMIKPSGWKTAKYDFVDGKYLYNRCHLIGFQLAGENANEKNLITGTRFLNVEGM
ncbi:DNA/RNA non-specific endonuclease, partial [[Clostridium] innocuum]|nr:DNA/RNA non-specific endonuclease [[Clostridium] innocuum]